MSNVEPPHLAALTLGERPVPASRSPSNPAIPEVIARASTAVEHRGIAEYFARMAADCDAEAAVLERMLGAYAAGPSAYPTAFIEHSRRLRKYFSDAAGEARALAQAHSRMAETAGK